MSTIDTQPLIEGMNQFISQVFQYAPLGLLLLGVPAAIGVGLGFGGKIINMVKGAFSGGK